METKEFGKKLKELRELKNEGQPALGRLLGVGARQIQRYESGELLPTHENLVTLCQYFNYDFISLIYSDLGLNGNVVKGANTPVENEFNENIVQQLIKEKDMTAAKIEEKAAISHEYAQEMKRHYEDAKNDKKELFKALAETRATINGVLSQVLVNLGDIKEDTLLGVAYQKAWIEYAAESAAQGDPKKKKQAREHLDTLLTSVLLAKKKVGSNPGGHK